MDEVHDEEPEVGEGRVVLTGAVQSSIPQVIRAGHAAEEVDGSHHPSGDGAEREHGGGGAEEEVVEEADDEEDERVVGHLERGAGSLGDLAVDVVVREDEHAREGIVLWAGRVGKRSLATGEIRLATRERALALVEVARARRRVDGRGGGLRARWERREGVSDRA